MNKRALITGVTGQDGAYLAKLLLSKQYLVYGTSRQREPRLQNLEELDVAKKIELVPLDLTDQDGMVRLLKQTCPHEVYNLAAQSSVAASFKEPLAAGESTGLGAARLLEAIRTVNTGIKFYQASTSEMFGRGHVTPQAEDTPFNPFSPYAAAKLYAHFMTVNYREAYGMFACSGILFNHESPLRGLEYVTRKITHTVAEIKHGLAKELRLGNLDVKRDWGYAPEYVEVMWLMMQQDKPADYVIATGDVHSVLEFVDTAFTHVGLDWQAYVKVDPVYYRPSEINAVVGDASKAKKELNWQPRTGFRELVGIMVDADIKRVAALVGEKG